MRRKSPPPINATGTVEADEGVSQNPESHGTKGESRPKATSSVRSSGMLHQVIVGLVCVFALLGCSTLNLDEDTSVRQKLNAATLSSGSPLKALYVGNANQTYAEDADKISVLFDSVSSRLHIDITHVGKHWRDVTRLLDNPFFAADYDVVIYNMCLPASDDLNLVRNAIAQTRDLGVGAVILPCGLTSFRDTSPWRVDESIHGVMRDEWSAENSNEDFPYWWQFVGIETVSKRHPATMVAMKDNEEHAATLTLPDTITSNRNALTAAFRIAADVEPLYTVTDAFTDETHPVVWVQTVGNGTVFATSLDGFGRGIDFDAFAALLVRGIAYVSDRIETSGAVDTAYSGNEPVSNYQGTTHCMPGAVVEAYGRADVQTAVLRALELQAPLKVISVPKAHSDNGFVCPKQGGLLLNVWRMNRILDLDETTQTVTVEPGVRAHELSAFLHEQGYAIRTMPDYSGVSIAGGIATGAHHSSLSIAAGMADMVTSLTLIDGTGMLRTFDGADAATAAVHLGVLGVVVEITLKVEPQFKLQYGFESGSDDGLEDKIEEMVRGHEYARVMWFAGNGRYIMDHYDRVDTNVPGDAQHNLWSSTGGIFKVVGNLPYRVLNEAPLRAQCDSANLRSRFWIPPFNAINSARNRPVGWSHKMLGSICQPGDCPWDREGVRSRTMEAAFPLNRLQEWMTDVREIIGARRACFPILGIYLRFLSASESWMAINAGQDVVAFEIHVPKRIDEAALEQSADVYDEIMQLTLYKYGGRPHWGKNSAPFFAHLDARQFSHWHDFMALKSELDPQGLFNNKLWDQMTGVAKLPSFPGCVLSRDCICDEDAHCGAAYTCESGDVYAEARVCRKQ